MKRTRRLSKETKRAMLPYGRQTVDADDIRAVVDVLKSDWMTTGPKVGEFERALAEFVQARDAVAVCNGTAALHVAVDAVGVRPGDEVIVTALSFASSANCIAFQEGVPVFADVDSSTLLIDPSDVARKISRRTKAIIAVDFAGLPCDYDALHAIAGRHGVPLIADACHAIGGAYKGRPIGSLANISTFSFHPVKNITTGEGGAATTHSPEYARRMRLFRNHGITVDFRQRMERNSWFYEMVDLGFNYRLSDIHCALGLSQLKKLPSWIVRRNAIALRYDAAFASMSHVRRVPDSDCSPAYSFVHGRHLYLIRVPAKRRSAIFAGLRGLGIGVNVHYIPIHLHPFYQRRYGTHRGLCPVAERAYKELISLPMFPAMTNGDVDRVIESVDAVLRESS